MCLNIQGKEKFVSEAEYVIDFFFGKNISCIADQTCVRI